MISFSPTLIDHFVRIMLNNGKEVGGLVIEISPLEIVLKPEVTSENVVRINRDQVSAYTGSDNKERNEVKPNLILTRCFNVGMRCNGVKKINIQEGNIEDCPFFNSSCEKKSSSFFNLAKTSQTKLLAGIQIGSYPSSKEEK